MAASSCRSFAVVRIIVFFLLALDPSSSQEHDQLRASPSPLPSHDSTSSPSQSHDSTSDHTDSPSTSQGSTSDSPSPASTSAPPRPDVVSSPPVPPPSDSSKSDSPEPSNDAPSSSPAEVRDHEDDDKVGNEEEKKSGGGGGGMSRGKKFGIVFGVLIGAGILVCAVMVCQKRQENIKRARYSYATRAGLI